MAVKDKQITEIVGFVGYPEPNATATIHYITFLDGLYFNLFARQAINNTGKLATQVAKTRRNLEANRGNYFVNTAGFRELP